MQPTAKVLELLGVLKDRGMNDAAIEHVKDGLWMQASERFMNNLLDAVTEDDLKLVEGTATQAEANEKLAAVFKEKTGKEMQDEMGNIVDEYAQELIDKHKMETATPVMSESTDQTVTVSDSTALHDSGTPEVSTADEVVHDL